MKTGILTICIPNISRRENCYEIKENPGGRTDIIYDRGMAMTGCGKKEEGKASVYYLNFKPEVAKQWEEIAKEYKKETGVEVKVVTAASGTYESTLKSEVAKKNPPTLFQVNGPIGYHNWKDYCLDLADTEVYNNLTDKDMAIRGVDGKGVYGIPYVVEGYGIIYNDAIMKKYLHCAKGGRDRFSRRD